MTLNHIGLILNIIGATLGGIDAWIRTRGITANSISVGHGKVSRLWKISGFLGYILLVSGFLLQYIDS